MAPITDFIVDRPRRDLAATLIGSYLRDEMTLEDWYEKLNRCCEGSRDTLLQEFHSEFHLNDDIAEPGKWMDKYTWDYLHRFQLLLQTDAIIEYAEDDRAQNWKDQGLLTVSVVLGICGMLLISSIYHYSLAFGLILHVVCVISVLRCLRSADLVLGPENPIAPFNSIMEIRIALAKCPNFRKKKFSGITNLALIRKWKKAIAVAQLITYAACAPALLPALLLRDLAGAPCRPRYSFRLFNI